MPIGSFISQPAADSFSAAYRPVILRIAATKTGGDPIPPVVYCDIYFNDVFYKTLSKTQYAELNTGVNTEWEFDIQDAAQEFLTKFLGTYAGDQVEEATPIVCKVLCKFRSSGYDSNGFIQNEDTAPVQATGDAEATSGTGTSSNTFYIVNATLQHTDNQELFNHLFYFKNRTWSADASPLSHRPDHYKLGPNHSDFFPILYKGAQTFKLLRLNYRLCGQSTFHQLSASISGAPSCNAIISDLVVVENGTGWLVSWDLISGSPVKYFVSTPAVSGGAPQETITTQYQYTTGQLPVGTHVITVRPVCFIEGSFYFGALKTVEIIVGACTGVTIPGGQSLPDAVVGVNYNETITVNGTQPITLSNIVKPSWMTISITGNTVSLTGVPSLGDVATGVTVSFDVNNCADTGTGSYSDTIDVAESEPSVQHTAAVLSCVTTGQITSITFNDVEIPISGGTYPISSGQLKTLSPGSTGTGTLKVFVTGSAGSVRVTDSNGSISCQNYTGAGTYTFAGFVIDTDFINIILDCGSCG